jgi:hypothetical protein
MGNAIRFSEVILIVIMLSGVILSVVTACVVAPLSGYFVSFLRISHSSFEGRPKG